jgi:ribosomal protein S27E
MKLIRAFIVSAGALLLVAASAKMTAQWAGGDLPLPQEPVFLLPVSRMLWIMAMAEVAVALICLFGRRISVQASLVFWLALNLAVYGWALGEGGAGFRGYLGSMGAGLGIAPGVLERLIKAMVWYCLVGSSLSLVWCWASRVADNRAKAQERFLKVECPHCRGRTSFPASGVGRQIPCPHCATIIVLRPDTPSTTVSKSCTA